MDNSEIFYNIQVMKVDKQCQLNAFSWSDSENVNMLLSYEPQGFSCKFIKGQTDFNTTAKHKNHNTAVNHKKSLKSLPLENGDLDPISDEEDYLYEFPITSQTEQFQFGKLGQILNLGDESLVLKFRKEEDVRKFRQKLHQLRGQHKISVFSQRTEDSSASQYFQFYGFLSQQQNMMQDFVRTSTYQKAIHSNLSDFNDKVVLDVGAGSGILSFFAAQAGARKVYAVEASNMAQYAHQLVQSNHLGDKITVIAGKIEEIDLPEKVDIIISEPMGYMLFNERMLETYLHAKKWLKKGGRMFPTRGDLHVAPFTDESLYMEQYNKANFWYQTHFHGVDLSSMRTAAMKEYFRQPVVDTFDIKICMSKSVRHIVDFMEADETDLHRISIPLEFHVLETGTCHGLAFWFDVLFDGSQPIWLSTSPTEPLTHWYQVRCLLTTPLFVKQGQVLKGMVELIANKRQSYDVTIELQIVGTGLTDQVMSCNTLDLKNPYFRYSGASGYTPGTHSQTSPSPSEIWWNSLDTQRNAINMVNGIAVNGMGEPVQMDTSSNLASGTAIIDPNIHPGCISSTGRGHNGRIVSNIGNSAIVSNQITLTGMTIPGTNILGVATSTQNAAQQQLIGGAISPSLFGQTQHATTGSAGLQWW